MRFFKTPALVSGMLPGLIWRMPGWEKTIYLTFDDGPIPEITAFVIDILASYQAQATFFCVGENIVKHPLTYKQLQETGQVTANHTYNHLPGWQTTTQRYLENVQLCAEVIRNNGPEPAKKMFRPPYGRISFGQYQKIKPEYQIVMWDVLTYDFDKNISPEMCLQRAIKNTKSGSIVVFHDSLKAARNLSYVLPRYMEHFANQGYRFAAL